MLFVCLDHRYSSVSRSPLATRCSAYCCFSPVSGSNIKPPMPYDESERTPHSPQTVLRRGDRATKDRRSAVRQVRSAPTRQWSTRRQMEGWRGSFALVTPDPSLVIPACQDHTHTHTHTERERQRETDTQRDRDRQRETETETDTDRDRDRDRHRQTETDRKQTEIQIERQKADREVHIRTYTHGNIQ